MTAQQTDERLKSYLDTHQLNRERLGLAVLALDRRYSDLKPRHPRGGKDGGRDIEGRFQHTELVYGAVGFVNGAHDSKPQRTQIARKFREDLDNALQAKPTPTAFAFVTNLNLPIIEKSRLIDEALGRGLVHAEIFDRERLRILLDSPEGLAARFQLLGIPLTEAEQAAFFARWGSDLQSLISDGFGRVESLARRIQFLHEAQAVLDPFRVSLILDREYSGAQLGHVRAFVSLFFKNARGGLFQVRFGLTDNTGRLNATSASDLSTARSGCDKGLLGLQWEHRLSRAVLLEAEAEMYGEPAETATAAAEPSETPSVQWKLTGQSESIGPESTAILGLRFDQDDFIRVVPRQTLADLDEAMFIVFLNESLARRVTGLRVFGNAYDLGQFGADDIYIDYNTSPPELDLVFSEAELADRWARIRPRRNSAFEFHFDQETPTRWYTIRDQGGLQSR